VQAWALGRFDKEPEFAASIFADPDPYNAAVEAYNKAQIVDKALKLDPEILAGLDDAEIALIKSHRASKGAGDTTETSPRAENGQFQPRKASPTPPKSILDAPSSNKKTSSAAMGPGQAIDDMFGS
jgi:hypothetical protein